MGQVCEVFGKRPQIGNQVTTRGRAKYLGGVGTKITGISRRQFRPNLRRVRITASNGAHKTVRICAQCLRSGVVTKKVHATPFRAPGAEKPKPDRPEAAAAAAADKVAAGPYVAPEGVKVRKRKRKKDQADTPEQTS